MLQQNSRVYHTGLRANGIITEVDETKLKDKYKVHFFWAKYVEVLHGDWSDRTGRGTKWQWCSADNLIEDGLTPIGYNYVTSIGNRSLDRLIRNVCEIKRRCYQDSSDVILCYGQNNHRIPDHKFLLNRNLVMNKYTQCSIMETDMAPRSQVASSPMDTDYPDDGWIAKLYISMGGRGIHTVARNDRVDTATHYLQRRFPKVREFRAHCFLWSENQVPMIQEKKINDTSQLCWNKKQGSKFWYLYQDGLNLSHQDQLSQELRDQIIVMSVKALKKLKYDFGGLDFGMDTNGKLTIFEVNSRVGLREQSLFTYKRVFNELRTLDINRYKEERWS